MFEDYVPNWKIGCLFPLSVIDNVAYEFYQLAPKGIMLVTVPVGLKEFTSEDVERVFASIDEQVDLLVDRGVHVIVQSGVPLPLLAGREFLARLLARIEARAAVPATSTVLSIVASAKHLGIKTIAVANKWSGAMNKTLAEFFGADGIAVAGVNNRSMVPSEFVKLNSQESITLAYELGRGALEQFPAADGVYIGGGTWLTLPVITRLEQEFGKPVITNQVATLWHVLHVLKCWQPSAAHGRLMAGD